MAKNYGGILGNFAGKVGNVVGQVSRGQQIIKAYQPKVNNPKSERQSNQRKYFRDAVAEIKHICANDIPFLDKKLGNGKTMYGELVGAVTSMKRAFYLGGQIPEKTLYDSPMGDFGLDFKFAGALQDAGQRAQIFFGYDQTSDWYCGQPSSLYTEKELDERVGYRIRMFGLDENGQFKEYHLENGDDFAISQKNASYEPNGSRPCGAEPSADLVDGFPYIVKFEQPIYTAEAGTSYPATNGKSYVNFIAFAQDSLGNIFSVKTFSREAKRQS